MPTSSIRKIKTAHVYRNIWTQTQKNQSEIRHRNFHLLQLKKCEVISILWWGHGKEIPDQQHGPAWPAWPWAPWGWSKRILKEQGSPSLRREATPPPLQSHHTVRWWLTWTAAASYVVSMINAQSWNVCVSFMNEADHQTHLGIQPSSPFLCALGYVIWDLSEPLSHL